MRVLFAQKRNGRSYLVEDDNNGNRILRINRQPEVQSLKRISDDNYENAYYYKNIADSIPSWSKTLCILGMGGATIAYLAKKRLPNLHITAIENDPVIIEIANLYFFAASVDEIVLDSAKTFCDTTNKRFDCVVQDCFVDSYKPVKLDAKKIVKTGGVLLENVFPLPNERPRITLCI